MDELGGNHTLAEWAVMLESLLARFFIEDPENQREMYVLRNKIRDLSTKQALSGFIEPVELETVRYYLRKSSRMKSCPWVL